MKTIISKTLTAGVGLFLAVNHVVKADTLVYDNSTVNTLRSLNLANGYTVGNEILLTGSATITSFEFELYNPTNLLTGTVSMNVSIYSNAGALVGGFPSPSASLFNDTFTFAPPSVAYQPYAPYDGTGGYGLRVIESGLTLSVPSDFTLAITISGLSGPDSLGLELYNSVTTGNSYNDYWFKASPVSSWQLLQTPSSGPNNFGARFYIADVPEPSTICLGLVGGLCLVFGLRQRRIVRTVKE